MVVLETPLVNVVGKKNNLNLVKFCDVEKWYSLEGDIDVKILLDPKVKVSTLDWIGIFREDWNTFESFVTFQRGIGKAINPETPKSRKVTFPFNKELCSNILLDFQYQFVYVTRYLDILGMSPSFKFLHNFKSDTKSVPTNEQLTLSEELLLSQCSGGGNNYPPSCRLHRGPMYKNTVTTCTHCRPCGHDYYNIKEKVEECYLNCLNLADKLSNLECEVTYHSHKLKEIKNIQNANPSIGQMQWKEVDVAFVKSDPPVQNITDQHCTVKHSVENDLPEILCFEGNIPVRDENLNLADEAVIPRSTRKDSLRSSSFPPNADSEAKNLNSENNYNVRKCVSDIHMSLSGPLSLSDVDSPLLLKAIIGHQEGRIRRLTQLLKEQNISEADDQDIEQDLESETDDQDDAVVKLVKTEERMIAQILRINNNCEEFSNEKELAEK